MGEEEERGEQEGQSAGEFASRGVVERHEVEASERLLDYKGFGKTQAGIGQDVPRGADVGLRKSFQKASTTEGTKVHEGKRLWLVAVVCRGAAVDFEGVGKLS
jgi:hypothetical protein